MRLQSTHHIKPTFTLNALIGNIIPDMHASICLCGAHVLIVRQLHCLKMCDCICTEYSNSVRVKNNRQLSIVYYIHFSNEVHGTLETYHSMFISSQHHVHLSPFVTTVFGRPRPVNLIASSFTLASVLLRRALRRTGFVRVKLPSG